MIRKINKTFKDNGYKKEKIEQSPSSDYIEVYYYYDENDFIELLKRDNYYSLFFHSKKNNKESRYLGYSIDILDNEDILILDEYLTERLK